MQKLSPHEQTVMEAIWQVWDGEGPVATKDFVPILKEAGWEGNEYFTYLRLLEKKGFIRSERSPESKRENIYHVLISYEECLCYQTSRFINKVGLKPFLSALISDPDLSEEALAAMQELLDERKK